MWSDKSADIEYNITDTFNLINLTFCSTGVLITACWLLGYQIYGHFSRLSPEEDEDKEKREQES